MAAQPHAQPLRGTRSLRMKSHLLVAVAVALSFPYLRLLVHSLGSGLIARQPGRAVRGANPATESSAY